MENNKCSQPPTTKDIHGISVVLHPFINVQDKLWEASSHDRSVEDDFGGVTVPSQLVKI